MVFWASGDVDGGGWSVRSRSKGFKRAEAYLLVLGVVTWPSIRVRSLLASGDQPGDVDGGGESVRGRSKGFERAGAYLQVFGMVMWPSVRARSPLASGDQRVQQSRSWRSVLARLPRLCTAGHPAWCRAACALAGASFVARGPSVDVVSLALVRASFAQPFSRCAFGGGLDSEAGVGGGSWWWFGGKSGMWQ